MNIMYEINRLENLINRHKKSIKKLQDSCPHERTIMKYRSNTGNWDGFDSYWIEGNCVDCNKRLSADSDDPNYRIYANRMINK